MRTTLALLLFVCVCQTAQSDPPKDDTLHWESNFSNISASKSGQTLVVMLITNDDPFVTDDPKQAVSLWCTPLVESVYRKALLARPELKEHCLLQSRACGMPRLLTGGQLRNQPSRAILAICDTNYRLLAMTVGIPDTDGMLTLIEDAQHLISLRQLNKNKPKQIQSKEIRLAVAERSTKRITRLWQEALAKMLAVMEGDDPDAAQDVDTKEHLEMQVSRIGETFETVYLADVKLRFGLRESTDFIRLSILEQHPEARQPWCDVMLPFVALSDFTVSWRPIVEAIWKTTPITNDPVDSELLDWWDLQIESDLVTLALQPPILARRQTWPPANVGSAAAKKGLGWQDLQALLLDGTYRNVDAQQLAALMRARELRAIDVQLPTRARYVLFQPKKPLGLPIHEGDLPAKFIGRVKRSR